MKYAHERFTQKTNSIHPILQRTLWRNHLGISILIPCHRVIGTNRSLTGYAGGIEAKRLLLNIECQNTPYGWTYNLTSITSEPSESWINLLTPFPYLRKPSWTYYFPLPYNCFLKGTIVPHAGHYCAISRHFYCISIYKNSISNYKNGSRKNPSPFICTREMPINTGVLRLKCKF